MIASGNVPIDDTVGGPGDLTVVPLSGEVSRWLSRMVGYAALVGTCTALAKVFI